MSSPAAASKKEYLRIAVVSDIHAFVKEAPRDKEAPKRRPSYLEVASPSSDITRNPIAGLHDLIQNNSIRADLLLCAGDLGDKSSPIGIKTAWEMLHSLGAALGAQLTTATAGNHDLDSRHINNKYDPRGFLMTLTPRYPLANEDLTDRYWARNYVILEGDEYRVVLLNSCGYHSGDESREITHGRVSEWTLDFLKRDLEASPTKPINILLCHHHPKRHPEIDYEDYELMKGGESLLEMLASGSIGHWLVIHGHKHYPKIDHAAGGNCAPVVFSAGSLCAVLYETIASLVRNQFYIITIPIADVLRLGLVGEVMAWDWGEGVGWQPASGPVTRGIPHKSGFGMRGSLNTLAAAVAAQVTKPVLAWDTLRAILPELKYILPRDLSALEGLLISHYDLKLVYDASGIPFQIGKRIK